MSNDYFRFKQFTIRQDRCAMKVGTDGVLLGAWANGGMRILDIGTGTGLIAMMMAQRFPNAHVLGIDVDGDACLQATCNINDSPFVSRLEIRNVPIQNYFADTTRYDAIVCNPPYFNDSLKNPSAKRTMARHTVTLSYSDLFKSVARLLADDGEFSAIIPFDSISYFQSEACIYGLIVSRMCAIRTKSESKPKRCLLAFRKQITSDVENTSVTIYEKENGLSQWYTDLTSAFYL